MNKIIIIIVIALSCNYVKSQTIRGFYIKQFIGGVGDDVKLSKEAKIPELYEYIYSNNKSTLKLLTKGGTTVDTLQRHNDKYNLDYETVETTIKMSDYVFVKNLKDSSFENIYSLKNNEIFIKDSLPKFNWNILDETKIIEGFVCKKANTTYTSFGYEFPITAWFCEQIPTNDGPFHFYNLPGFIFELSSDKLFTIKFVEFKYDDKKSVDIRNIETELQPITIKELENKWRK